MAQTDYAGIDYSGHSMVNINTETGIRYGVIPANEVGQSWYDTAQPYYGENTCPKCGGQELSEIIGEEKFLCDNCKQEFDAENLMPMEPLSFYIEDDEIQAEESTNDYDIFIFKSEYYTYAQFCSPCAPGACYLLSPLSDDAISDNNKCYCFGHDWFDSGTAPYPVYSVETGELVAPVE